MLTAIKYILFCTIYNIFFNEEHAVYKNIKKLNLQKCIK